MIINYVHKSGGLCRERILQLDIELTRSRLFSRLTYDIDKMVNEELIKRLNLIVEQAIQNLEKELHPESLAEKVTLGA